MRQMLGGGAGIALALLTLIQVSPIKLDPWSAIARAVGKALNGELTEKVDALQRDVTALQAEAERTKVVDSRFRILRFDDELYAGMKHSREHFNSILQDITIYNSYCAAHPDFKNALTVHAQKHIEDVYDELYENREFI